MEKMGAKKLPFRDVCERADIFAEAFDDRVCAVRTFHIDLSAFETELLVRTKSPWPVTTDRPLFTELS